MPSMPLVDRLDVEAVLEWAAAVGVAIFTVSVSGLFVYHLARRDRRPLSAALRPWVVAACWAGSLAGVAAAVFGSWVIFDGWGLLWLLFWLLGPPGAAAVASVVVLVVRPRAGRQPRARRWPRHRRWRMWRALEQRRHKGLRERKSAREASGRRAKADEKKRDDRDRRAVARYLLTRDRRRCGGCGNKTKSKVALVSNVVADGYGNFDVGADRRAISTGTRWNAVKDNIDNVQAVCSQSCASSGADTTKWRHPLLVRLPVATHKTDPRRHLWLPYATEHQ